MIIQELAYLAGRGPIAMAMHSESVCRK